jgi:predicted permease
LHVLSQGHAATIVVVNIATTITINTKNKSFFFFLTPSKPSDSASGSLFFFIKYNISFRLSDIEPVFKVLNYLSSVATPLALLVLGIQFEFSAISGMKKEIIIGVLIRTVFVPLFGLGIAYLLFSDIFNGAHFATFVAVFATPVAVSSVPMVQEMDGDVALAGQLVIWTTLVSAFTVFIASFILKSVGIF